MSNADAIFFILIQDKIILDLKKMVSKSDGVGTLKKVLGIYNYDVVDDVEFLTSCARSFLPEIAEKTVCFYPSTFSEAEVDASRKLRHPVYMGRSFYGQGWVSKARMKSALGYTKEDVDAVSFPPQLRYAICGPVVVKNTPQTIDTTSLTSVMVAHVWGVDLSSLDSLDARYVFSPGVTRRQFLFERYVELLSISMAMLEASAIYAHRLHKKPVVLRITGIGLGVWATFIPPSEMPKILKKYESTLESMAVRYRWLQVRWVKYPTNSTFLFNVKKREWILAESNHDPFGKPRDVEDPTYIPFPKKATLLLVNAWDNLSFIGNGGSKDNTLDGWMVSGGHARFSKTAEGRPLGANCINSSFLHNAPFIPNMTLLPVVL
jgi:hypothetical protein